MHAPDTTTRERFDKRVRPLLVAVLCQSFVLWYAIEKPFQDSIGLSASDMALIAVVISVVILVVNVPLGVLADRWSRSKVMALGGLMLAVSSMVAVLSNGLISYMAASVCFALFMATHAGGYDAILYDTAIEEFGDQSRYLAEYGRFRFLEGCSLAVSSLLGGLSAWLVDERLAFALTIPFALVSIVALLRFVEPRHHLEHGPVATAEIARATWRIARSRMGAGIVLASIATGVAMSIMQQLDQLWMLALDFPLGLYGPLNAVLLACLAAGGFVAARLRATARNELALALVGVLAGALLLIASTPVVVVGQSLFLAALAAFAILMSKRLHDVTDSRMRSSVTSAVATVAVLVFIPTAIAFGHVADGAGVFSAAWISFGVTVAIAAFSLAIAVSDRRKASSLAQAESTL